MAFEGYADPEDIISDFLRVNLTDPRARAEASESDTFTATAGQTSFTLTPTSGSVSCVTAVTVAGTAKTKWKEYYWDYQNQKIILATGATVGQAVVVTFKYGTTNWIYSDKPDSNISAINFPRISIFNVSGGGTRLGSYKSDVESNPMLQIDIWAKKDQTYTIDSRKYSNNYLTSFLGNRITRAFEKSIDDLHPALYDYNSISIPRAAPYSEEYQAFHSIVEVALKGIKIGRIEYT